MTIAGALSRSKAWEPSESFPPEIRQIIYELLLTYPGKMFKLRSDNGGVDKIHHSAYSYPGLFLGPRPPFFDTIILRTCWDVYLEAHQVILTTNKFYIDVRPVKSDLLDRKILGLKRMHLRFIRRLLLDIQVFQGTSGFEWHDWLGIHRYNGFLNSADHLHQLMVNVMDRNRKSSQIASSKNPPAEVSEETLKKDRAHVRRLVQWLLRATFPRIKLSWTARSLTDSVPTKRLEELAKECIEQDKAIFEGLREQ